MFIIDDILLSPIYGVIWLGRKLSDAAREELVSEKESITFELSELYMTLETGRITESEFDQREKELLDRLTRMEESGDLMVNKTDPQSI
ncbi:MAG TPA: gas vesicle protein GvpG [Acidobacteriota bacterium]|nr:gas vesicle protein GvpG [Acidobacteriota bacterium]